jgi:hypothetical protein
VIGICFVVILATSLTVMLAPGARASPTSLSSNTVKVPCGANLQAAINAAHPGATILVAPCTYTEQLTIMTSITLIGSGVGRTIIRSPAGLAPDAPLVNITNGATVALEGFTVSVTTVGVVGVLVNGATATLYGNSIQATVTGSIGVVVLSSVATITSNVIVATATPTDGQEIGIYVQGSQATITGNLVQGPGLDGMFIETSSVTVEFNIVSEFSCKYNQPYLEAGLCGPNWATQFQAVGVGDFGDIGLGSTIAYNLISSTDAGVLLDGCPGCVVQGNTILNSLDYGMAGMDGAYAFGPNTVFGGTYGVGAAALVAVTTVTLSHVVIVHPSVAPLYLEPDLGPGTATIVGTWTVIG